MVYTDAHIDNRIECSQLTNSNKNCIQMKSEPSGASSPESSAEISTVGPDDCAGCGRLIQVICWNKHFWFCFYRFRLLVLIFPHEHRKKKFDWNRVKIKNKISVFNFFFLLLNWIRIVFIYRLWKNDGTQLVFNVMYVNSCLKVKHRVFHGMEIFIVNQTTTGMCQNQLNIFQFYLFHIHHFKWLDKNNFSLWNCSRCIFIITNKIKWKQESNVKHLTVQRKRIWIARKIKIKNIIIDMCVT